MEEVQGYRGDEFEEILPIGVCLAFMNGRGLNAFNAAQNVVEFEERFGVFNPDLTEREFLSESLGVDDFLCLGGFLQEADDRGQLMVSIVAPLV